MSMNSNDELQARYIAGAPLSSDEASSLLRWLKDNPDKRHAMLADESLDGQLHCLVRLNDNELTAQFISETVHRAFDSQLRDDRLEIVPIRAATRRHPPKWSPIAISLCVAAAVLVVVGITFYSVILQNKGDVGFAQIPHSSGFSWEWQDVESRFLNVSSGEGKIHFKNGTIVQLSAPAVIELKTASRLFVKKGSVKINVPPAAIGFTVETPIARIVDLGTEFDVDVGESGQTGTLVRSGTVTFQTHPMSLDQSAPIKLTARGLNRVSATPANFDTNVQSVTTTASGSNGQFYGTIYADGRTMEFGDRQEYDEFLNRLQFAFDQNPSQFREQWQVIVETTANGTSTMVESSSGNAIKGRSSGNPAHEMLIDQLRSMQEQQANPQMHRLLEGMLDQAEKGNNEFPEK